MQNIIRRPHWLNKKINLSKLSEMQTLLKGLNLNTVCNSAACPNIGECFSRGEAAFMILGEVCSRNCKFCNIEPGKPKAVDYDEPNRVAEAVKRLNLKHAVITSVTRDDLSDGGAEVFYETILAVKNKQPEAAVEVLIPDFKADKSSIKRVVEAKPDIIAHNVETVPRLYPEVRPQADYKRSLSVLKTVKEIDSRIYTKSGLMLGLGEEGEEVLNVFEDLRKAGCDFLSLGQYLSPSLRHFPVKEYIEPEKFEYYKKRALDSGFISVQSAPYVRSSYRAEEYLMTDNSIK